MTSLQPVNPYVSTQAEVFLTKPEQLKVEEKHAEEAVDISKDYVKLNDGTWVDRVEFGKLSAEDQTKLKEVGVNGFNDWKGAKQDAAIKQIEPYKSGDSYKIGDFISNAEKNNQTQDQIKQTLKDAGFSTDSVNQTFTQLALLKPLEPYKSGGGYNINQYINDLYVKQLKPTEEVTQAISNMKAAGFDTSGIDKEFKSISEGEAKYVELLSDPKAPASFKLYGVGPFIDLWHQYPKGELTDAQWKEQSIRRQVTSGINSLVINGVLQNFTDQPFTVEQQKNADAIKDRYNYAMKQLEQLTPNFIPGYEATDKMKAAAPLIRDYQDAIHVVIDSSSFMGHPFLGISYELDTDVKGNFTPRAQELADKLGGSGGNLNQYFRFLDSEGLARQINFQSGLSAGSVSAGIAAQMAAGNVNESGTGLAVPATTYVAQLSQTPQGLATIKQYGLTGGEGKQGSVLQAISEGVAKGTITYDVNNPNDNNIRVNPNAVNPEFKDSTIAQNWITAQQYAQGIKSGEILAPKVATPQVVTPQFESQLDKEGKPLHPELDITGMAPPEIKTESKLISLKEGNNVTIKIPESGQPLASGAIYPESIKVASESGVTGLPRTDGLYYKGGDPNRGIVVEYFIEQGQGNIPLSVWYKDPGGVWVKEAYSVNKGQVEIHCTQGLCDFHASDLGDGVRYVIEKGWKSYTPAEKKTEPIPPIPSTTTVVIPPIQKLPPPAEIKSADVYQVPESPDEFAQWKADFDNAVKQGQIIASGIFAGKNEDGNAITVSKPYYDSFSDPEKQVFNQQGIAGIEHWAGQNAATQKEALKQLDGYSTQDESRIDLETGNIPVSYKIAQFAEDHRNNGESPENIARILVTAGFEIDTVQKCVSALPPAKYLSDKEYSNLSVDGYAKYKVEFSDDPRVKYGAEIVPSAMPGDVLPTGLIGSIPSPITWAEATRNVGKEGTIAQVSTRIGSIYGGLIAQQQADLAAFGKELENNNTPIGAALNTLQIVKDKVANIIVAYDPAIKATSGALGVINPLLGFYSNIPSTIDELHKPVIEPVRNWFTNDSWTTAQMETYLNQDKESKIKMWADGKVALGWNKEDAQKFAEETYAAGNFGTGLLTMVHTGWELGKFLPSTAVVLVDNWEDLSEGDRQSIVDTVSLAGSVILFPVHAVGGLANKVSAGQYWSAGGELAGFAVGAIVTPTAIVKTGIKGGLGIYDLVQAARGKAILSRALNFRTDIPLIEVPDVFKTIEQIGEEKLNKLYLIQDVPQQRAEIRKLLNPETAKVYDAQLEVIDKLANAPVRAENYATVLDLANIVKRLPDPVGAARVKAKLQEYGKDIIVGGSLSDNAQMAGIKGKYPANDIDIKTLRSEPQQVQMAQELAIAYGNAAFVKGRKVYVPGEEKPAIDIHTFNEFPAVEFGFQSELNNNPVIIDGIYFEDIRNQILRRGKEAIRPGIGEEGTGLMGIDVSGMEHRANDVLRYGIIANMLLDNLRKEGKIGEADILQGKLDMVFKAPRGEAIPSTAKGEVSPTEQEFLSAVDEALRNVITAGLDTQTKIASRPAWLKELVNQGSQAVDIALKDSSLQKVRDQVNAGILPEEAYYSALNEALKTQGVKIYRTGDNSQALPIPKTKVEQARIDNAVNLLTQETVIPNKISTTTQRGTFTRELTPVERAQPLTIYSVVRDGTPYQEAVAQGRPVISGWVYDENGKLVPAENPAIYFASQAALDRYLDLYKNKPGDNPLIVAFELTPADLFDIVNPVNRVETLKRPAKFQIVDKGGGGEYIEYKAALDEWTTKEGTSLYGLLDDKGKPIDVYTRHKRTGDKLPIMYFTSERGLEAGIRPPTPKAISSLLVPAVKGSLGDLFHPHLAQELVFDKEFSAMGEQGLIDFYKKDWKFKPATEEQIAKVRTDYAKSIVDKALAEINREKMENKPVDTELMGFDDRLAEYKRQQEQFNRITTLTETLSSRDKPWGDIRYKENRAQAEEWVKEQLKTLYDDLYPGEFSPEFIDRIAKNMTKHAWTEYKSEFARINLPKIEPKPTLITQREKTIESIPVKEVTTGIVTTATKTIPTPSIGTTKTVQITTPTTTPLTTPVTTPVTTPITPPITPPVTPPITPPIIPPITPPTTPPVPPVPPIPPKPPIEKPPIIIKTKHGEVAITQKQIDNAIAWKQGIMYITWLHPHTQADLIYTRKPIAGVKYFTGPGSAAKSIVSLYGEVPSFLHADMGVVDINIKGQGAGQPLLTFREDKYASHRKHKRKNKESSIMGVWSSPSGRLYQ